jgi:glycerol-3-phosphate dehydrogenase
MTRDDILANLDKPWDIVVVGGGITGAGVFSQACEAGYSCLLLEQRDFAWGTSSRSGKLVHGGLRYIAQGQIRTSFHSVQERQALLKRYAGLVTPLDFVVPVPPGGFIVRCGLGCLLAVYDQMAGRRSRQFIPASVLANHVPPMAAASRGAWQFTDGTTDDARLVLRVLADGRRLGGVAANYVEVKDLLRDATGRVAGVAASDRESGRTWEVRCRVVINATGVWADELRQALGYPRQLRQLRGSHLVFPHHRLPLTHSIALQHPKDRRNMYVIPWEGRILVGTTDLDHQAPLSYEPRMAPEEGAYLLETIQAAFPDAHLVAEDVISTTAGVRPVVNTGKKDPSKESRDEVLWVDPGMVTISGGKLTTYRYMAMKALRAATRELPPPSPRTATPETLDGLSPRLLGRYGPDAPRVLALAGDGGLQTIADTQYWWEELDWAATNEQVLHLEDLLLRRTRVGLLLPNGGADMLSSVRARVQTLLGWTDDKWNQEVVAYQALWQTAYSPSLLTRTA